MSLLPGLPTDRCLVMGVVNVTPDSFSDGGQWFDPEAAIRHGHELLQSGADIVDIGGESTRPGADRIDPAEEQRRILPVVSELAAAGAVVSVDTMNAVTAELALARGAAMINDVSGGRADPQMAALAADAGCPFVVMHWRAHADQMQKLTQYDDVVADVLEEITAQVDAVVAAGVQPAQIIIDPGLGFSKTASQNWEILAHLDSFVSLGRPVLVAASRKRFLGELLAEDGELRDAAGRDHATAAITGWSAHIGAWAVRVHEVPPSADAVLVAARLDADRSGVPGGLEDLW